MADSTATPKPPSSLTTTTPPQGTVLPGSTSEEAIDLVSEIRSEAKEGGVEKEGEEEKVEGTPMQESPSGSDLGLESGIAEGSVQDTGIERGEESGVPVPGPDTNADLGRYESPLAQAAMQDGIEEEEVDVTSSSTPSSSSSSSSSFSPPSASEAASVSSDCCPEPSTATGPYILHLSRYKSLSSS
ncbi:hypothetical protein NMY22_g17224 [Coprinellus aureogranulatus]|nr:hypothetical protein NMY22_g17224 [Coprinellus aureogranulatus]